jgi:hypothetical protein
MIALIRNRKFHAAWAAILILSLSTNLFATRVCCEGEKWLGWSNEMRQAYVFAYVSAYSKGFAAGCAEGTRNIKVPKGGGLENDPTRKCRQKTPDFSRGTDYFVRSITDFYKRYPSDRDIYIDELIDCFADGLSVDDAHRHHFPSRDKPG